MELSDSARRSNDLPGGLTWGIYTESNTLTVMYISLQVKTFTLINKWWKLEGFLVHINTTTKLQQQVLFITTYFEKRQTQKIIFK